jgi:hypothetical protein
MNFIIYTMKTLKHLPIMFFLCLLALRVESNPAEKVWIGIHPFPGGNNVWVESSEPGFIMDLNKKLAESGAPQVSSNDSINFKKPEAEETTDQGNIFTFNNKNKYLDCIAGSTFILSSYLITFLGGEKDYAYYEWHVLRVRVGNRSFVDAEAGGVWCLRLAGAYLGFKGLLEYLLEKIDRLDYTDPVNYSPFDLFEYLKEKEKKEKEKKEGKPESFAPPPPAIKEFEFSYSSQSLEDRNKGLNKCAKFILKNLYIYESLQSY